jgi:hypothetical protein
MIVSIVITTYGFKVLMFLLSLQHLDLRFYCLYCNYNVLIRGFIVSTVTTTFGFKVVLFLLSLQHLDSKYDCFYCH